MLIFCVSKVNSCALRILMISVTLSAISVSLILLSIRLRKVNNRVLKLVSEKPPFGHSNNFKRFTCADRSEERRVAKTIPSRIWLVEVQSSNFVDLERIDG